MNAATPWNPLREIDSFGQRLNRLLDRLPMDFQPAFLTVAGSPKAREIAVKID